MKKLISLSGERIEEIVASALKEELGGDVSVRFQGLRGKDTRMSAITSGDETFDLEIQVTTHDEPEF